MSERSRDRARLGSSLRRIRAADRALPEGGKKVWHQGDGGVEVLSFVDARGAVTRQECYLDERVVAWQAGHPLVTGRLEDEASCGGTIAPDAQLAAGAVLDALSLLDGADLDDNYLRHLRAVLRLEAQRLPPERLAPAEVAALRRVTGDQPAVGPEQRDVPPRPARAWLPWAVAAGAVALGVAALLMGR